MGATFQRASLERANKQIWADSCWCSCPCWIKMGNSAQYKTVDRQWLEWGKNSFGGHDLSLIVIIVLYAFPASDNVLC